MIKPLHDRIAVREFKKSEFSDGGIFIGEQIDDGLVKEMVYGEILAVGPGLMNDRGQRDSMWGLNPGDVVAYSPVCSHKLDHEGEEITMIRRDAIVGIKQMTEMVS